MQLCIHSSCSIELNTWFKVQSIRLRKSLQHSMGSDLFAFILNQLSLAASSHSFLHRVCSSYLSRLIVFDLIFLLENLFHHALFVPLVLNFFTTIHFVLVCTSPLLQPSSTSPLFLLYQVKCPSINLSCFLSPLSLTRIRNETSSYFQSL